MKSSSGIKFEKWKNPTGAINRRIFTVSTTKITMPSPIFERGTKVVVTHFYSSQLSYRDNYIQDLINIYPLHKILSSIKRTP
jgi:hypothetical protein